MSENQSKQHVQLPTPKQLNCLTPKELYTYLIIKKYMDKNTYKAYPSIERLTQETHSNKDSLRKYINNLEKANYLTVIREKGKSNIYVFNKEKLEHFEPFSYEFLDNSDLSVQAKMLYVVSQQYLFMDEKTRTGSMNYSPTALSQLINLSPKSIMKYQKELIEKGYLTVNQEKDNYLIPINQSKIYPKKTYTYDIDKLQQQIIFVLKNHEDRIQILQDEQKEIKKQLSQFLEKDYKTISDEQKEIKKLLVQLLENK